VRYSFLGFGFNYACLPLLHLHGDIGTDKEAIAPNQIHKTDFV